MSDMDRNTDTDQSELLSIVVPAHNEAAGITHAIDVIATTNLNGHYLESLALAATGEIGLAPNGYVGAKAAVFQATHNALPKAEGSG